MIPLYSLEKLIEWKLFQLLAALGRFAGSLLAREINWMETRNRAGRNLLSVALYSLEKLIEWKQENDNNRYSYLSSLYSLEKLIEWKH